MKREEKPKIRIRHNGYVTIGHVISGRLPRSYEKLVDCGPTVLVVYPNCITIHFDKNA